MSLRNAMILAINTSLLAVLFVFSAWLYRGARAEAQARVAEDMDRAAAMTRSLAGLRERELGGVALSLAASPMLRGAVATGDRETVEDVLASVAAKNSLDLAAVTRGGSVLYARATGGKDGNPAFLAETPLGQGGDISLRVGQRASSAVLDSWSAITGVRYALRPSAPGSAHNLPAEDAALAAAAAPSAGAAVVSAGPGKYYARETTALDGRLRLTLFHPYAPFWRGFEATRNSLVVLGSALFFLGLLLSVFFAGLIERHALREGGRSEAWAPLLDEIERARTRILEKG